MPRRPDPRTVTLWRDRVQRFLSSGLSVAHFCSQEGVSSWSFYKWRRRLAQESPIRSTVEVRPGSFRQLQVIASAPGLSIHLASGTRIEISGGQLDMVRAVVGELARADVQRSNVATC